MVDTDAIEAKDEVRRGGSAGTGAAGAVGPRGSGAASLVAFRIAIIAAVEGCEPDRNDAVPPTPSREGGADIGGDDQDVEDDATVVAAVLLVRWLAGLVGPKMHDEYWWATGGGGRSAPAPPAGPPPRGADERPS
jgi:hypothetical protein